MRTSSRGLRGMMAPSARPRFTCPEQPDVGCGTCASCVWSLVIRSDVAWVMPMMSGCREGSRGARLHGHAEPRPARGADSRAPGAARAARPGVAPQGGHPRLRAGDERAGAERVPQDAGGAAVGHHAGVGRAPWTAAAHHPQPVQQAPLLGPLPVELVAERVRTERADADTAQLAPSRSAAPGAALALDVAALARRKDVVSAFESLRGEDAVGLLRLPRTSTAARARTPRRQLERGRLWTRDVALAKAGAGRAAGQSGPAARSRWRYFAALRGVAAPQTCVVRGARAAVASQRRAQASAGSACSSTVHGGLAMSSESTTSWRE